MPTTLTGIVLSSVPPQALKEWVRELPKLQALSLWNGSSFGQGAEEDIRDNCQEFKNLALYRWQVSQPLKGFNRRLKLVMFLGWMVLK
jgi:hypothetical protein